MKKIITKSAFSIVLISLLGCTSTHKHVYASENQPHALIKGDWVGIKAFGSKTHTSIIEIDGRSTTAFFWAPKLRVTPGIHAIRICAGDSNRAYYFNLEMKFEDSKVYQVQAYHDYEDLYLIKVIDEQSGEVVFDRILAPSESINI